MHDINQGIAESKGEGRKGTRMVRKSNRKEDWLEGQGWAGLVGS